MNQITNVIDFISYRDRKNVPSYNKPVPTDVSTDFKLSTDKYKVNLDHRLQKIRVSLDKINTLMSELKRISKPTS